MARVPFLISALWGSTLIASFVGSGRWIAVGLGVRVRPHLGLELAWGFAATLALGGWLCWAGLGARPVLAGLVGVGLIGCLRRRVGARQQSVAEPGLALRAGLVLLSVGLLSLDYATALLDPRYQAPDDGIAYFLHARKILETGTLYEPFSFRRMASYGGQSFLHALLLVVAPIGQLNLLDKGVCRLAVAIALVAYVLARPNRSLAAVLVVVYAVFAYQDIALNTASLFSGVLAFVGLWMTLEFCRSEGVGPIPRGILTGLVAAGTLSLRQNYGLACVLVVCLEHASRFRTARDPRQAKELLCAALGAALCVGGWALLQLHSCGTPLFPLLRGYANPEWDVLAAGSLDAYWTAVASCLRWPLISVQLGLAALALLRLDRSHDAAGLRPLAAAALLAFAGNVWLLGHISSPADLARYVTAFLLPVVLFGSARSAEAVARVRSATALRDWRIWLCGAFLLALLWLLPPVKRISERVHILRAEIEAIPRFPDYAGWALRYTRLQSAVPRGETLLVMLDDPYLLDLRRNDIVSLDLPGGVSPPPGLWAIGSPREVVGYLRGLGYSWLAAVRPERAPNWSFYELERWSSRANGTPDDAAWRVMGQTALRLFGQLDEIVQSCRLTFEDGHLVVIDLAKCRFDPS